MNETNTQLERQGALWDRLYSLHRAQRHIEDAIKALKKAEHRYTASQLNLWLTSGHGREIVDAQSRIKDVLQEVLDD